MYNQKPISWDKLTPKQIEVEVTSNPDAYINIDGNDPLWLEKALEGIKTPDELIRVPE
jgi:hypothetical protein